MSEAGRAMKSGRRGRLLFALGLGFLIDSAEDLALPMLFPAIRATLGLSYGAVGVMTGVRVIFQTFSGPFWGMAADRYNRKWVLVIGAGFWGIWTSVCGLAGSYWQLLAAHTIACIGLGCLYPAAFSIVADSFGPRHRGKAMGAIGAVGMLGIVGGAFVFGEMVGVWAEGWRWAFMALGLASVFSGVVILVVVREPIRGAAEPELSGLITAEGARRFPFRVIEIREILERKTVWVNFAQGICLLTPINSLTVYFVTWLVDDRGFSESQAPVVFGAIVISLAAGSFVGGVVADWADGHWPRYGRIGVSQASILLTLPAMYYLLTRATTLASILGAGIVAAFFLDWTRRGVKQPLVQNVVRPELRSTAMALTEFVQGTAASIIIMLFGGFATRHGLTAALLVLVCGFWAAALVVTTAYYAVYPADARRLRLAMEERRQELDRLEA